MMRRSSWGYFKRTAEHGLEERRASLYDLAQPLMEGDGGTPPPVTPPAVVPPAVTPPAVVPSAVPAADPGKADREVKLRQRSRDAFNALVEVLGEDEARSLLDRQRTPAPQTGGGDPGEAAALKRRLDELESRDQKRESETRTMKIESGVDKALVGLSLTDADEARAALMRRVVPSDKAAVGDLYLAADGKLVTKIKDGDKERDVEVTPQVIRDHKLLKPIYFKAQGVGGAGTRSAAGAGNASTGPVDMTKINDPAYYTEHRDEILRQAKMSRT